MARNGERDDREGSGEGRDRSEWGQGVAGGYGRSGDYGRKGGEGREGGADAGEGIGDDTASDADRSDAGDEGPGRGAD